MSFEIREGVPNKENYWIEDHGIKKGEIKALEAKPSIKDIFVKSFTKPNVTLAQSIVDFFSRIFGEKKVVALTASGGDKATVYVRMDQLKKVMQVDNFTLEDLILVKKSIKDTQKLHSDNAQEDIPNSEVVPAQPKAEPKFSKGQMQIFKEINKLVDLTESQREDLKSLTEYIKEPNLLKFLKNVDDISKEKGVNSKMLVRTLLSIAAAYPHEVYKKEFEEGKNYFWGYPPYGGINIRHPVNNDIVFYLRAE